MVMVSSHERRIDTLTLVSVPAPRALVDADVAAPQLDEIHGEMWALESRVVELDDAITELLETIDASPTDHSALWSSGFVDALVRDMQASAHAQICETVEAAERSASSALLAARHEAAREVDEARRSLSASLLARVDADVDHSVLEVDAWAGNPNGVERVADEVADVGVLPDESVDDAVDGTPDRIAEIRNAVGHREDEVYEEFWREHDEADALRVAVRAPVFALVPMVVLLLLLLGSFLFLV